LLTALLAAAAQGACSIAMPPGPRGESFVADASEVTGSIRRPSPELAREDV